MTQKKKTSVSTVSSIVKKIDWKNLRRSRKPLLSAVMVRKRLGKSTRLLNDLKNHGNRILIFSDEKTFTSDLVFNKQSDRVYRLGMTQPHQDAWNCSIEWEEDASSLVWTELHDHLCSLQRSFGDESFPWVRKITKKSDFVS